MAFGSKERTAVRQWNKEPPRIVICILFVLVLDPVNCSKKSCFPSVLACQSALSKDLVFPIGVYFITLHTALGWCKKLTPPPIPASWLQMFQRLEQIQCSIR